MIKSSNKKVSLGQFFTKRDSWLKPHIVDFIKSTDATVAVDPFAGAGDLLEAAKSMGYAKVMGFDVDESLAWSHNDSLESVPLIKGGIIITNPPYLTNYSAKRKGVYASVAKYFKNTPYEDLYQLAIEKCLLYDYGVMIVPETFINSKFSKSRLASITIIEEMVFDDTENPICVICFDGKEKSYKDVKVYKNDKLLGDLDYYESLRKSPLNSHKIKFNTLSGQIALRAVDTTNPNKLISFMKREDLDYDLSTIKESSRLITLISVDIKDDKIESIIENSNRILSSYRASTHDILLSPFKGNKKNGERRRRLDYQTARAILEDAHEMLSPSIKLF